MTYATVRPFELEQYKDVRQDTIAIVLDLTQAQSEFRPRPGVWSAGEILDHLVKSQRLYQEQFERLAALSRTGQRPVIYLDHTDVDFALPFIPKVMMPFLAMPLALMNAFVPSSLRETLIRNRALPAQNPRSSQPGEARPMDELRKELRDSMDSLQWFFVTNADLPFDKMRACHPAMGNNNIPALLRITAAHEERHQGQIHALLKDPGFPPAASRKGKSQRPDAA